MDFIMKPVKIYVKSIDSISAALGNVVKFLVLLMIAVLSI